MNELLINIRLDESINELKQILKISSIDDWTYENFYPYIMSNMYEAEKIKLKMFFIDNKSFEEIATEYSSYCDLAQRNYTSVDIENHINYAISKLRRKINFLKNINAHSDEPVYDIIKYVKENKSIEQIYTYPIIEFLHNNVAFRVKYLIQAIPEFNDYESEYDITIKNIIDNIDKIINTKIKYFGRKTIFEIERVLYEFNISNSTIKLLCLRDSVISGYDLKTVEKKFCSLLHDFNEQKITITQLSNSFNMSESEIDKLFYTLLKI